MGEEVCSLWTSNLADQIIHRSCCPPFFRRRRREAAVFESIGAGQAYIDVYRGEIVLKKCMGCLSDIRDDMKICSFCGYSMEQAQKETGEYPDRLPVETILGDRYILGRLLSINDYSLIYNAWDALLEINVVIREYFPSMFSYRQSSDPAILFTDSEGREKFELGRKAFEADAQKLFLLQSLDEIPNYYRIIRANNTSYIVMEYLEGITLEDHIAFAKDDPEWPGKKILGRIDQALGRLHQNGVLHLNLSPDNIYLCSDDRLCLIDFGSAKTEVYRLAQCEPELFREEFTAPEVINGKTGDRASDLYSFGCVYYYLTTGILPQRKNLNSLKGIQDKHNASAQMIKALTRCDPEKRTRQQTHME